MNSIAPENLLERISQTEPEDRKKPVEQVIAELRQAGEAFSTEMRSFSARGVPDKFCLTASVLADELEQRESIWFNSRGGTPEQKRAWKELYPKVIEERDALLDSLEMVLIDNRDAMRTLDSIREGNSAEDTLLDISKLVETAKAYPAESRLAGVTPEHLASLAQRGREYEIAHAKTLALPGGSIPAKTARDKARTLAELYLSRVRFHADRVFRNNPEKRAMFTSKYSARNSAAYRARQKAERNSEGTVLE